MAEIEFDKYQKMGAYHWKEISYHPLHHNAFVAGRYKLVVTLVKTCFDRGAEGRKILDVGCGDGALAYLMYRQGAEVFGIDSSDLAIRHAKEKTEGLNIDFRQGSAYELPWKDSTFDAVVSSDVIEHVQNVDKFLSEIRRVVKTGGSIVISTPIRFTEEPLDTNHVVEWFPEEYKRLILRYFPYSKFYQSHPVFWTEMLLHSPGPRMFVNLLSFIKNPFENFKSKFRYNSLQFSVSKKI